MEKMMEKILEIQNLHVDYEVDKVMSHAVNGIDISLNKGEILGLVGETGAGKTTTALGILGLLPKYITHISGSIKYKDQEIIGAKAEVLQSIRGNEISMIFQDPMTSLNPVFTIGKQIGDVIKINRGMQMDIDNGIALENELFAMCFATEDQKEGMGAFLEKRPAEFKKK